LFQNSENTHVKLEK